MRDGKNGKYMLELFKKTYGGKKVFITGHTGFKGSWLLQILHLCGAELKGYALKPENPFDLYHLIDGDAICYSVIDDIRNRERLIKEIVNFQPDFIFHLAAQPLVRLSYEIPVETFEVNTLGTANLLDAVRLLNKKCTIVVITTDKVYHNYEWPHPYRENDRLGGYDPYSASKACAELVIESYRNCFFNLSEFSIHQKAIAVARAGNVIGGGDWAKDRLLPDIARALGNNQTIVVRNPISVRPWQHVLEPLCGYLQLGVALVEKPVYFSQAYNFGPYASDALSVEDMVKISMDKWGSGNYDIYNETNQLHEAGLLKLDISKAVKELNWHPKLNACLAVEFTIHWYKKYFENKAGIITFTEQQIQNFFSL